MPQAPSVPHRALVECGTAGYAAPKGVEGILRSKKPAPITPAYFQARKTALRCKKDPFRGGLFIGVGV